MFEVAVNREVFRALLGLLHPQEKSGHENE